MVQEHGMTAVVKDSTDIIERPEDTQLTSRSIENISQQMVLAEQLVDKLLRQGIDYGTLPGTQGPGLWDAGAAKIIRAFGCHAEHKILFKEQTDELMSWTIEAQLINRAGEIVGSGLGACSTRETKYRYRWVNKTEALRNEYAEENLALLKTKPTYDGKDILYRIDNPDAEELTHTLLTMAAKRSECDAAKSLPGVASALRAKFDEKPAKATGELSGQEDLSLPIFWSMTKGAGLSEEDVHKALGVASMKTWKESGRTFRDAIQQLMKIAVTAVRSTKKTKASGVVDVKPEDITEAMVKTVDNLVAICNGFWGMTETDIFKELGYASREAFVLFDSKTLWHAWLTILEVKQPAPKSLLE